MRTPKLTSAALAAAALMVLATAGPATAHPRNHLVHRHAHGGVCRVQLQVAPRLVTSGETALAYGRELCGGTPEPGQTVTLYERPATGGGFSVAGTTTTDSMGYYQLPTPALTNNSVFYAAIGTSSSLDRIVKVAAQVTLVGPSEEGKAATAIRTGRRNAVTFTGTVSPADAGATVLLQRENAVRGNEWHWIGRTVVTSSGTFAITHVFVVPGESDIRVLVRASRRNIASPSNVLSYAISQAQNPSLTILSSADPIPYGGSFEISGVAAGAPGVPVTLMAHTAHHPATTAGTTTTNSEGKYAFPGLAPTASTFYTVKAAGRSSAVLYEGVKYVLTAAPLAESVQSGQPITFTGAATPAVVGHTIYLERQDVNVPGGFHVVAVGTVGPGGTYSVSRVFYNPGAYVLRVRIPGDPENGGTASPTFDITVTPAPSSALAPEPSGNGKLPPEGTV